MKEKYNVEVTVLMSVYNEDIHYLEESIESILNQTYKNFEFIIFDDCSTNENMVKMLRNYARKDTRIVLISNAENKGLTRNLYDGVNLAKGKYICRQDSDDISIPTRIEEQVRYMNCHCDISVLCTAYYIKSGEKIKKRSVGFRSFEGIKARLFIENSHIMHGSVIIRNSFLIMNNINYDTHFKKTQDYDLWTRVVDKGNITILPIFLCVYRKTEKQISSNQITAKEQRKYYKEIILRQIQKYYPNISKEQSRAHISLATGEYDASYINVLKWIFEIIKNPHIHRDYKFKYLILVISKRLIILTYKYLIKLIRNK